MSLHGADVVEGLHPAHVGGTPANGTSDAAVLTAQSWTAKARSSDYYHILKVDIFLLTIQLGAWTE